MGFFSSIFGGGSSSSSAASKTEVTVNPTTNIDLDFDTDNLAAALERGNELSEAEKLIMQASLELQAEEAKANLLLTQQSLLSDENTKEGIKLLIVGGLTYFAYKKIKNLKKGKK